MTARDDGGKRRIGKTDLWVPRLGLGLAHLGGMNRPRVTGETAHKMLATSWELGIRYFDTAPYYGNGLSEHRAGSFLMDMPRDAFVLTTKVGRVYSRPADPRQFDPAPWTGGHRMQFAFDYSYEGVMRSYEDSLQRTGLDTIDALLIHDPEPYLHGDHYAARLRDMTEGGARALAELRRGGAIKAVGAGLNATDSVAAISDRMALDFVILAMPYTLLDQSALDGALRLCADRDISVVIGAPFASGILATGPVSGARYAYAEAGAGILAKTRRIAEVCETHGVGLRAAALQFPLAHPAVAAIIPGAANAEEVSAIDCDLRAPIPAALWAELREQELIDPRSPVPAGPGA